MQSKTQRGLGCGSDNVGTTSALAPCVGDLLAEKRLDLLFPHTVSFGVIVQGIKELAKRLPFFRRRHRSFNQPADESGTPDADLFGALVEPFDQLVTHPADFDGAVHIFLT